MPAFVLLCEYNTTKQNPLPDFYCSFVQDTSPKTLRIRLDCEDWQPPRWGGNGSGTVSRRGSRGAKPLGEGCRGESPCRGPEGWNP